MVNFDGKELEIARNVNDRQPQLPNAGYLLSRSSADVANIEDKKMDKDLEFKNLQLK